VFLLCEHRCELLFTQANPDGIARYAFSKSLLECDVGSEGDGVSPALPAATIQRLPCRSLRTVRVEIFQNDSRLPEGCLKPPSSGRMAFSSILSSNFPSTA
jgi:hypothetical protein